MINRIKKNDCFKLFENKHFFKIIYIYKEEKEKNCVVIFVDVTHKQ